MKTFKKSCADNWTKIRPDKTSDSEVVKLFPCSTQQSMKIIMLINVKMLTIVGILPFISMINTSEIFIFSSLVFMSS